MITVERRRAFGRNRFYNIRFSKAFKVLKKLTFKRL
jgi:hypothetical protein